MRHLRAYEKFVAKTLSTNNNTYDRYLNLYKGVNRAGIVAWERRDSQLMNYQIVSTHIMSGDSVLDYGCGIGDFKEYLDKKDIKVSDYLGVDINHKFIDYAKELHPNDRFQVISNMDEIKGSWDVVVAIGVFTWYITKEEFIDTINKLHQMCRKSVVLTLLEGVTPYSRKSTHSEDWYWDSKYRYYDKELFTALFPNLKMSLDEQGEYLVVKIDK